ncbi:MAG: adenine deaminase [Gemmatimonadetes bacterium]|nr:adenine deaminase [Gemmatimonadota bacterium]
MELKRLLALARGDEVADLLLKNAQMINVFSSEVHAADVAVAGGVIVGLGKDYAARETVDLDGRFVAPGFIDAHVHIESSMVTPREFARAVVPCGVTTVVTDPHEIANVCGLEGIRFMLADAHGVPFTMLVNASSCVPATHMETSGASLSADDLATLKPLPGVLGLAEVMNFPGVVHGDDAVLAKLSAFADRVRDGHAPGLTGKPLNASAATGISSDHECTTIEEAREKLRLGMTIFVREATNARNLRTLIPLITAETERRCCFCTDDRQPADLLDEGSIDHLIRLGIAEGLHPVTAIRMGTLNPAEHFRLHDRGAIAPGRRADLVVFTDLQSPRAERVYVSGQLVAENGRLVPAAAPAPSAAPAAVRHTVHVDLAKIDLAVPATGRRIRVIGAIENQLITNHLVMEAARDDGRLVADPRRDLLKMVVIERHRGTGNVGKGFVTGVGLQRGALAGTVAHDHHNLVVIGADDRSMLAAARAVAQAGGGQAAADGDTVLALLPLPIAGLMSDQSIERVRGRMDQLLGAARQLGSTLHDPFMAMSFLALEVIPKLKLTDVGLVDVEKFELVPLVLKD